MASGAISSLLFGRLLDRIGLPILIVAFSLSALSAPFVFAGGAALACVGMMLWGIGNGAQSSLVKAVLAEVVVAVKRSTAFGLYDTCFGVAWFTGSAAMGFLYEKSITTLIIFSLVFQLAALPVFFWGRTESTSRSRA